MENLPEEIKEIIISLSGCYVYYVLGREPDGKKLFLEGGIMVILGQVLERGADIRTLIFMKQYLSFDMAIRKTISYTHDLSIIVRICLIWDCWKSNHGYIESVITRFRWGIDNLQSKLYKEDPWRRNFICYIYGMIDEVDMNIDDPLKYYISTEDDRHYNAKYKELTEKEYIDKSNLCFQYSHICHSNVIDLDFDDEKRIVYYPKTEGGYTVEEIQCVVAHQMYFGKEGIEPSYDDNPWFT